MRNTPKLQETMEVFNKDLETLKKFIKEDLSVDMKPLNEFKKNLNQSLENYKSDFERSMEENSEKMNNKIKALQVVMQGKKERLKRFYIYTTIAFLIALGGMYFGIRKSINAHQLKFKNQILQDDNSSMFDYLKKNDHLEEYKSSLNEESEK